MRDLHQELASCFSGPLLFDYVWWVLYEAKRLGLERLYFLARDGYTLHRVAKLFCQRFHLEIECRYLYCSRASLRMPSYFLIGDEAFDLLLLHGYYTTLRTVLERGGLTAREREAVYAECGLQGVDEDQPLSHADFTQHSDILRKSRVFRNHVVKKSRLAYADTIGYLKAEGLCEQERVAIVDSGWTGSVQRSLRQLLEFSGFTGRLVGFYFGMYAYPKVPADGEYHTWYFDAGSNIYGKIQFCNNLFECLLSAPHGMTISYRKNGEVYEPVRLPSPMGSELQMITMQSDAICNYAEKRLEQVLFENFDAQRLRRKTMQMIRRYMYLPTAEEAGFYGQFRFCDDVTESYQIPLAEGKQMVLLKQYSIPRRILRRLMKHPAQEQRQADLFWPFGTIAFLPCGKREWYRWNICAWEWLKYILRDRWKKPFVRSALSLKLQDLEAYDVVSFDVFDTLLYRVLNHPTDVFRLMEPVVEERFGISDFAEKRIAAERIARRSAVEEVTLAEIYEVLLDERAVASQVMQLEKETEMTVIRQERAMAALMIDCIKCDKKVLILSDMYQDKAFLQEMLDRCGIRGYHAIYVSSEERATKSCGTLFCRVAEREGITDRRRWIHIGDNLHSDYDIPRALGLSAYWYDNGRKSLLSGISLRRGLRRLKTWISAYGRKGKADVSMD